MGADGPNTEPNPFPLDISVAHFITSCYGALMQIDDGPKFVTLTMDGFVGPGEELGFSGNQICFTLDDWEKIVEQVAMMRKRTGL